MTAPNAQMSNDEILSTLKRAASKLEAATATVVFVGGNVGFETQCNDYGLMRVHAAVAAMAEREAEIASKLEGARIACNNLTDSLNRTEAARDALVAEVEALRAERAPVPARALAEWHQDDGSVMWFAWCGHEWAGEPAWCGRPDDDDWPGYHTHWVPHPKFPPAIDAARAEARDG